MAAALLYSKYHAVLIVLFVLLSNLKLFRYYQTYMAGVIALLFFAPHLLWQYQHDWVSFRYHLFESNVNPYKFSFTLEYVGGQILLLPPWRYHSFTRCFFISFETSLKRIEIYSGWYLSFFF